MERCWSSSSCQIPWFADGKPRERAAQRLEAIRHAAEWPPEVGSEVIVDIPFGEDAGTITSYPGAGERVPATPPIDFAADPEVVRTVAEGERLGYGHLFNPAFATEISRIDPLPHQRI